MKKVFITLSIVFITTLFYSCKKNEQRILDITPTAGTALVKINYSMPFAVNSSVQIKINDVRVSNLITFPTPCVHPTQKLAIDYAKEWPFDAYCARRLPD